MSEPFNISDFDSIPSDIIVSQCSSLDDVDDDSATNQLRSTKSEEKNTCDTIQRDLSLTDNDQSLLEVPKLFNASSPSSICSTKPLEWDSGADVGYAIITGQQCQDMSTIERIAVSSFVCNANSTPMDYQKIIGLKKKSNSLINLNGFDLPKGQRSASVDTFKCIATKSDTFPKYRSPMASSLSVSTVVHKLETLNVEHIFEQEKRLKQLNNNSNIEQKSIESSKESTSTLESVDTAGSWVAKEFGDSTNTTTDRVNSFEYLPGNAYYNGRVDQNEDYSDTEIKQSTKLFVEAMKENGLTNKLQRKEIFKEIIESFLTNYVQKANNSSEKSTSDTDQTPIRQDFTSQTSNTGNTIVNNQKNNQSSTITFTSPITSSRYGDDADSKYDESSMDSGRHIDFRKCKIKKVYTTTYKLKNQGVQCSIKDSITDVNNVDENVKQPTSTKSNISKKEGDLKCCTKHNGQKKTNCEDINKGFKKQMVWFHKNYLKTERENQMLWINNQISHLNNLKKLLSTHEELKKNWNSYKQQKPTTQNKSKYRCSHPISNSNSDLTTTTKSSSDITTTTKTDSTISSKHCSVRSRCVDTDAESSNTVCDHVHYKKGIIVDEPKSMKKCCEKTLYVIKETQKQSPNKLKTIETQTESINEAELTINETTLKQNKKYSTQSGTTYTVKQKLKPICAKNSITYDIIFKPSTRCQKYIDDFDKNESKQQLKHSISVACQTNKIPFQPKSSLQEYLLKNRPDYVNRADERQTILTDIANLRDERNKLKKDLLITHNIENKVPPNPLAVKRIMSQKEMRKQTERKYRKCPEVQNKKVEIKRKEEYKTNKIIVDIFNKKLQKKTLKGNVDLSNSISVCSV